MIGVLEVSIGISTCVYVLLLPVHQVISEYV